MQVWYVASWVAVEIEHLHSRTPCAGDDKDVFFVYSKWKIVSQAKFPQLELSYDWRDSVECDRTRYIPHDVLCVKRRAKVQFEYFQKRAGISNSCEKVSTRMLLNCAWLARKT